jgi:CheY-like chemotaxis protein
MLQRLGHKVTTAENGEVALQMMAERHQPGEWGDQFHIVFLDK